MPSLSDAQIKTLMALAADIPPKKRPIFLEHVAAMLAMHGRFLWLWRNARNYFDIKVQRRTEIAGAAM